MCKKIAAVMMAMVMLLGSASAFAEITAQEKVYVVMDAAGTVKSITDIIHLENEDGADEIQDRTMLTNIECLDGPEGFTLEGEVLTWQAGGRDVIYQGTSDKEPAVRPVVRVTVDGAEVPVSELKNQAGEVTMTVSYAAVGNMPALAVTAMILPQEGITGLKTENAIVLKELGQEILVGWGIPGISEDLHLPTSFSVSFHSDHASPKWAMTVVTSDPLALACREIDSRLGMDLNAVLASAEAVLTALKNGEMIPAVSNAKLNMAVMMLNTLNTQLAELDESAGTLKTDAASLADGATSVAESAANLSAGLEGLETPAGADQVFTAMLDAANAQIAASGLAESGVTVPKLTADNYSDALDKAIAALPKSGEAAKRLTSIKEQLTQTQHFVNDVKAYTEGVAQATESAKALNAGASELQGNANALKSSAAAVATKAQGLKQSIMGMGTMVAALLLPYVQETLPEVLEVYNQIRDQLSAPGYDLRGDDIVTRTIYIMRTDFQ